MALTETYIRSVKPGEKRFMKGDGRGLWLLVYPNGRKSWRMRYWVNGKEKTLSLGTYPEITLSEARQRRDMLHRKRAHGEDPAAAVERAKEKAVSDFKHIADEWIKNQLVGVTTEKHIKYVKQMLESYVFPRLADKPVSSISASEVLTLLRDVEAQGKIQTAHKTMGVCSRVLRYAVITGRAERDPVQDLKGALKTHRVQHMATLTGTKEIQWFLKTLRNAEMSKIVEMNIWFSIYTFARPGEIRNAEWTEVNFEDAEWRIPEEKMKMRRPHIVPLARQVVVLLKELHKITGRGRYLFASGKSGGEKPIGHSCIYRNLRRTGVGPEKITLHGFRGMASTRLNEMGFPPDVIERQLAHLDNNTVRQAYNHADYMKERKKMMQVWADWLDGLLKE